MPTALAAPHLRPMIDAKAAMRRAGQAVRAGCDPGLGVALGRHVMAAGLVPAGAVIAGYWPLGTEIDIRPLLVGLRERGHAVVLPETPGSGHPLVFRAWEAGSPMVRERFGTMRPEGSERKPDVLLVPLLAFDLRGNRLGYGGGYYDRTIAALPGVRTIGCGYGVQKVDAVPVLPHDAPLDAVATEHGIVFRRDG